VLEAIQTCWASANSRRVSAYQSSREAGKGAIAVLIQPLVEAEMAGGAFTANPITGDRTEASLPLLHGGARLNGKTPPGGAGRLGGVFLYLA
jgi:phosphoenolpyruvate synthase/pyruvate phosphate dikinase